MSSFISEKNEDYGKYTLGVETQESIPTSTNAFNGTTYNENVNPYYIEKSDIIVQLGLLSEENKSFLKEKGLPYPDWI